MLNLIEYISEKVLLGDGAMGTELYRRGVPKGNCYDELNLSHPELVEAIHRDYIAAGARLIKTNSFGANRQILGKYYNLMDSASEICERGAKIARAAASWKNVFVAGSIGPITRVFESEERLDSSTLQSIFIEQAEALIDGGVDCIILETFSELTELVAAIEAIKKSSPKMPIIASMSFIEGTRTVAGIDPYMAATTLTKTGADIVGANCGAGPRGVFEAIKDMAISKDVLISAIPNAGLPTFSDGRFEYNSEPAYFAYYAKKYMGFGVKIIGGCCGTTPAHIAAISEVVTGQKPKAIRKVVPARKTSENKTLHKRVPTRFEHKLAKKFVYTMEIDPPKGVDVKKLIAGAKIFKSLGGDAINISDIPMARLRMAALPLAASIKRREDIDVILHVTARDRNLIAIQSDLLGANALGIDNILALRGDPPSVGDYPFATGVFDVSSEGIVSILSAFSRGVDRLGVKIDSPANFFTGVAVNQNSRQMEKELDRLTAKIEAGAGFVQTQPVFDIELLKKVIDFVDGRTKVIASLMVLSSQRQAEFLHNEVPGIRIPAKIRADIAGKSGKEARICGLEIAKSTIEQIREIADGVCLMLPFGRYSLLEDLL